jgi:hypothetical protein
MPSYRVTWTIDIDADGPYDAARRALQIQRDPASIATVFDVTDRETGKETQWDVTPEGE